MDAREKSIPGRGHSNASSRGWLVLSERKKYAEEMRLARQLGPVLIGFEHHSKDSVFILSEAGAAGPLSAGRWGWGFSEAATPSVNSATISNFLGAPWLRALPLEWLQTENTFYLSRPLISCCLQL